jgi:hypothetical protein
MKVIPESILSVPDEGYCVYNISILRYTENRNIGKSNNLNFESNNVNLLSKLYFCSLATAVGGAYINGTAEVMGRDGIVWTFAPVGFAIGISIGMFCEW